MGAQGCARACSEQVLEDDPQLTWCIPGVKLVGTAVRTAPCAAEEKHQHTKAGASPSPPLVFLISLTPLSVWTLSIRPILKISK